MFTIDKKITDLRIREKNPFKVFFSMNIHQVATPETSLEEARSYVFFCREGRDKISAYVGLHFLNTDRKLFYTQSENPFSEDQLPEMEDEARRFAEDLGAMLDEIDLSRMSGPDKDRWIDEQEILSARKKETTDAEASLPAANPPAESSAPVSETPAETSAPVVPAAPLVQASPAPAQPPQTAPVHRQQPASSMAIPVAPARQTPIEQPEAQTTHPSPSVVPVQPAPPQQPVQSVQPQKKVSAPDQTSLQYTSSHIAPESEQSASPFRIDDVLEQAVKAGVVKAPKAQLKKDIRSATGVVPRDKEALARLLSSF